MKRILTIALLALMTAPLIGDAQQQGLTTNSAFADAIIAKCALADWPVSDPQCAPLILALGKIVLNQSKTTTQPTTIGDTPAPPVQPAPVATPAATLSGCTVDATGHCVLASPVSQ